MELALYVFTDRQYWYRENKVTEFHFSPTLPTLIFNTETVFSLQSRSGLAQLVVGGDGDGGGGGGDGLHAAAGHAHRRLGGRALSRHHRRKPHGESC